MLLPLPGGFSHAAQNGAQAAHYWYAQSLPPSEDPEGSRPAHHPVCQPCGMAQPAVHQAACCHRALEMTPGLVLSEAPAKRRWGSAVLCRWLALGWTEQLAQEAQWPVAGLCYCHCQADQLQSPVPLERAICTQGLSLTGKSSGQGSAAFCEALTCTQLAVSAWCWSTYTLMVQPGMRAHNAQAACLQMTLRHHPTSAHLSSTTWNCCRTAAASSSKGSGGAERLGRLAAGGEAAGGLVVWPLPGLEGCAAAGGTAEAGAGLLVAGAAAGGPGRGRSGLMGRLGDWDGGGGSSGLMGRLGDWDGGGEGGLSRSGTACGAAGEGGGGVFRAATCSRMSSRASTWGPMCVACEADVCRQCMTHGIVACHYAPPPTSGCCTVTWVDKFSAVLCQLLQDGARRECCCKMTGYLSRGKRPPKVQVWHHGRIGLRRCGSFWLACARDEAQGGNACPPLTPDQLWELGLCTAAKFCQGIVSPRMQEVLGSQQ